MNVRALVFLFLMGALTSCQSVPAERTNDCACDWNTMRKIVSGSQA